MLIFQDISIQISPKPLLFSENVELESSFNGTLGLREDAEIFCHVASIADGTEKLDFFETELVDEFCGIATVNDRYSESDIYLFLPERQFDFFVKAFLSLAGQRPVVRLTIVPRSDFKIANRVRVHMIDKNPMMSLAGIDAA